MARGAGKYDGLATWVRSYAEAAGVIVVVIDGRWGSGFSVQATGEVTAKLPELLRTLADNIESDLTD